MSWSNPLSPTLIGSLFLIVGFVMAVVASRRNKDKLAPILASISLGLLGVFFLLPAFVPEPPEGVRINFTQRLVEIPVILFTVFIYWWIAGRFRMSRHEAAPHIIAAARPKMKKVLLYSPVILFCAWFYSLVVFWLWPQPEIGRYQAADPAYFVLALPAALPGMAYAAIATWVFLKSTQIRTNKPVTIKNTAFGVAFGVWLTNNVGSLGQAAAASYVENPARRQLVNVLFTVQDYLLPVFVLSLGTALVLTATTSGPITILRGWITRG